jgi:release factor glutamine methyltransferase
MMEAKVLEFEPSTALFVSDEDPLLFYRRIGEFGQRYLNPEGELYFEINEALGTETLELMQQQGYTHLELRKDLYGKERMIKGVKKTL